MTTYQNNPRGNTADYQSKRGELLAEFKALYDRAGLNYSEDEDVAQLLHETIAIASVFAQTEVRKELVNIIEFPGTLTDEVTRRLLKNRLAQLNKEGGE